MALGIQPDSHLLVAVETLRRDWTQGGKFKERRGGDKVGALESCMERRDRKEAHCSANNGSMMQKGSEDLCIL